MENEKWNEDDWMDDWREGIEHEQIQEFGDCYDNPPQDKDPFSPPLPQKVV